MARGKKNANGAGTIGKVGNRYVARVSVPGSKGKKRKTVSGRTYTEAHQKMVKLQAEMNGKPPPQEAEVQSAEAYIKRWLSVVASTVSPASLRSYRLAASLYIIPTVGHISLQTLERFHIEEMKAKLSSYCKPASVRFALKTFSTALNAAVDAGYIETNPARNVKRPKNRRKMRALSQEEAARLMAVVKPEERAYYDVAMKLGLRQGELAALKWENVDLSNKTLMVEATVDTLTAGER